ncbi:MAG: CinA domain protein [Chloroflexi bacterium]|jgi:PncC family amidohydrolase|nr:CinA domain protein [Chloroflexota bacterium]
MLENKVGELLRSLGLTLSSAESCTGGLVGHRLTNVPGSSEYYLGGVISYDNRVKQGLLQVPAAVLETAGAVSEPCALAMAHGVRQLLGTSLAVSTTGIAGPGGATPGKPVGLVFIALADANGYERCESYVWTGDRETNKALSAEAALKMVGEYLERSQAAD